MRYKTARAGDTRRPLCKGVGTLIVASFFNQHAVFFALICAVVAIAYGIGLTVWLLRQPDGNERMREIARAIQEGAARTSGGST